ncbi:DUF550 domain-containing protein [Klebsiella pneumoniae]|nr:dATP/dGTP pyrophosphohydrolase domain-containing protein [Klebsiella pneumoniae]MCP3093583.1 DUF550 domain-containing protein [Klebsiella pneumoniae]
MTSKFSIDNRELLQRISSGEAVAGIDFGNLIVRELAAFRLAAMDSESVGTLSVRHMSYSGKKIGNQFGFVHSDAAMTIAEGDYPLYRHAQPAPERDQVRIAHAEWSQATFGNVGPVGPLKHLSKEALEAAEQPGDLSEWADMQFLLWDAQRRAGITDEQITQAMIEKLAVNKQRKWPEPKDGEPRLHINEQPALTGNFPIIGIDLASGPERTVEVRYVAPPGYVMVPKEPTDEMLAAAKEWTGLTSTAEVVYIKMLAAAPQSPGSDPATVPGKWIPVSERMPEDSGRYWCYVEEQNDLGKSHYQWNCSWNGDRWWVESENGGIVTHWMPLTASPQEVKGD